VSVMKPDETFRPGLSGSGLGKIAEEQLVGQVKTLPDLVVELWMC
jgi:hypothetical protein